MPLETQLNSSIEIQRLSLAAEVAPLEETRTSMKMKKALIVVNLVETEEEDNLKVVGDRIKAAAKEGDQPRKEVRESC